MYNIAIMLYYAMVCRVKIRKRGRKHMSNKKKILSLAIAVSMITSAFTSFAAPVNSKDSLFEPERYWQALVSAGTFPPQEKLLALPILAILILASLCSLFSQALLCLAGSAEMQSSPFRTQRPFFARWHLEGRVSERSL